MLRIHEIGCGKCEVRLSCCVFVRFCENGSKEVNYDFDDFEWINEVVVLS